MLTSLARIDGGFDQQINLYSLDKVAYPISSLFEAEKIVQAHFWAENKGDIKVVNITTVLERTAFKEPLGNIVSFRQIGEHILGVLEEGNVYREFEIEDNGLIVKEIFKVNLLESENYICFDMLPLPISNQIHIACRTVEQSKQRILQEEYNPNNSQANYDEEQVYKPKDVNEGKNSKPNQNSKSKKKPEILKLLSFNGHVKDNKFTTETTLEFYDHELSMGILGFKFVSEPGTNELCLMIFNTEYFNHHNFNKVSVRVLKFDRSSNFFRDTGKPFERKIPKHNMMSLQYISFGDFVAFTRSGAKRDKINKVELVLNWKSRTLDIVSTKRIDYAKPTDGFYQSEDKLIKISYTRKLGHAMKMCVSEKSCLYYGGFNVKKNNEIIRFEINKNMIIMVLKDVETNKVNFKAIFGGYKLSHNNPYPVYEEFEAFPVIVADKIYLAKGNAIETHVAITPIITFSMDSFKSDKGQFKVFATDKETEGKESIIFYYNRIKSFDLIGGRIEHVPHIGDIEIFGTQHFERKIDFMHLVGNVKDFKLKKLAGPDSLARVSVTMDEAVFFDFNGSEIKAGESTLAVVKPNESGIGDKLEMYGDCKVQNISYVCNKAKVMEFEGKIKIKNSIIRNEYTFLELAEQLNGEERLIIVGYFEVNNILKAEDLQITPDVSGFVKIHTKFFVYVACGKTICHIYDLSIQETIQFTLLGTVDRLFLQMDDFCPKKIVSTQKGLHSFYIESNCGKGIKLIKLRLINDLLKKDGYLYINQDSYSYCGNHVFMTYDKQHPTINIISFIVPRSLEDTAVNIKDIGITEITDLNCNFDSVIVIGKKESVEDYKVMAVLNKRYLNYNYAFLDDKKSMVRFVVKIQPFDNLSIFRTRETELENPIGIYLLFESENKHSLVSVRSLAGPVIEIDPMDVRDDQIQTYELTIEGFSHNVVKQFNIFGTVLDSSFSCKRTSGNSISLRKGSFDLDKFIQVNGYLEAITTMSWKKGQKHGFYINDMVVHYLPKKMHKNNQLFIQAILKYWDLRVSISGENNIVFHLFKEYDKLVLSYNENISIKTLTKEMSLFYSPGTNRAFMLFVTKKAKKYHYHLRSIPLNVKDSKLEIYNFGVMTLKDSIVNLVLHGITHGDETTLYVLGMEKVTFKTMEIIRVYKISKTEHSFFLDKVAEDLDDYDIVDFISDDKKVFIIYVKDLIYLKVKEFDFTTLKFGVEMNLTTTYKLEWDFIKCQSYEQPEERKKFIGHCIFATQGRTMIHVTIDRKGVTEEYKLQYYSEYDHSENGEKIFDLSDDMLGMGAIKYNLKTTNHRKGVLLWNLNKHSLPFRFISGFHDLRRRVFVLGSKSSEYDVLMKDFTHTLESNFAFVMKKQSPKLIVTNPKLASKFEGEIVYLGVQEQWKIDFQSLFTGYKADKKIHRKRKVKHVHKKRKRDTVVNDEFVHPADEDVVEPTEEPERREQDKDENLPSEIIEKSKNEEKHKKEEEQHHSGFFSTMMKLILYSIALYMLFIVWKNKDTIFSSEQKEGLKGFHAEEKVEMVASI